MVVHAVREVRGNLDVLQFGQVIRVSKLYLATSKDLPDAQARRWESAWAAMRADGSAERIIRKNQNPRVDAVDDEKRRIQEEPFR